MSLSQTSESAPLQFKKRDVCIQETATTTMKTLKTEIVNAKVSNSNHDDDPHLEDRLKPPDVTNNCVRTNGSCDNGGLCCEPINGFSLNMSNCDADTDTDIDNLTKVSKGQRHSHATDGSTDCYPEVKDESLQKASDSDSNLSTLTPYSEKDIITEFDNNDNYQTANSTTSNNDRCVDIEKLIEHLENTSLAESTTIKEGDTIDGITYVVYESEKQMPDIMRLITKDLSEPYSIYTYRYFIHNWPKLCFLAMDGDVCVGAIVCKLDLHKKMVRRGYIAMLAVDSAYRRRKLGSTLVTKAIKAMIRDDCDEVVLETEITNQAALHLYENLGFVRDKRLFRYYLNGVDALRLKLWLR